MLRISVIIPAYNSASTVCEAIDSVFLQNVQDLEVIVVDDASSDDTVEVAESMFQELQVTRCKWKVLRLEENYGPAAARNRGISEAKGEWLAFLDADDVWLPGKLAMQMEYLKQNPDIVMVCGGTLPWNGNVKAEGGDLKPEIGSAEKAEVIADMSVVALAKEAERRLGEAEVSGLKSQISSFRRIHLDEFAFSNPVATSTVLVRKDVLSEVGGFDQQFRGPEDYDLWMRIAANHSIALCSLPLACYRETVGSLSMDDRKFLPMVLRVLEKAFGSDGVFSVRKELFSTAISNQYWNASWMAFRRGARLTALRYWLVSYLQNAGAEKKVDRKWFSLFFRYLFRPSQIVSKGG